MVSYEDSAVGIMTRDERGREWITTVRLQPYVVFDGHSRPSEQDVDAMHRESHERCYIANSVKSEVVIKGRAEGVRASVRASPRRTRPADDDGGRL